MRILRYILLNPIGIAFAVVHWVIAAYAMLGDFPSADNFFHGYTLLQVYLTYFNLPALSITHLFAAPTIYVFALEAWMNYVYTVFAIIFCSIQWLLFGTLVHFAISMRFPKSDNPSIISRSL